LLAKQLVAFGTFVFVQPGFAVALFLFRNQIVDGGATSKRFLDDFEANLELLVKNHFEINQIC